MNLSELSDLLQQLLLDNDIVFLPGMGSFVVEDVPSEFRKGGQLITPPSRKITFRSSENRNDGLLTAAYSKLKNIPEQKAAEEVSTLVRQMKKELIEKAYVEIPGFGTIRFGEGYNFVFVPDTKLNVAPDSFGLEALSLKTKEEAETTIVIPEPEIVKEEKVAQVEKVIPVEEEPVKEEPVAGEEDFIISAADIEPVLAKAAEKKEEPVIQPVVEEIEIAPELEVPAEPAAVVPEEPVRSRILDEKIPVMPEVPENESEKVREIVVKAKEPLLSPSAKKTLVITAIVIGALILVIAVLVIFKDQFMPFLEKLLYSKEELQILHQAGR